MSDQNATTPRVFIARHGRIKTTPEQRKILITSADSLLQGETEWTISGQCTGNADIPLTENGVEQSKSTGDMLVGPGKLIDPSKLAHVFCSPRRRAVVTLDLLLGGDAKEKLRAENKLSLTEDIAEWDYGNYEGKTPSEIKAQRDERGLPGWNIWVEGCEGGE